jgi:hypothetical protein
MRLSRHVDSRAKAVLLEPGARHTHRYGGDPYAGAMMADSLTHEPHPVVSVKIRAI